MFLFCRGRYEKSDDDISSSHEHQFSLNCSPRQENHTENSLAGKTDMETNGRSLEGMATHSHQRRGGSSGSINLLETGFPVSKVERYGISRT